MTEPLVTIVERDGRKYRVIEVDGVRHYSLEKATEVMQCSKGLIMKFINEGRIPKHFKYHQYHGAVYIPESTVLELIGNRLEPVVRTG